MSLRERALEAEDIRLRWVHFLATRRGGGWEALDLRDHTQHFGDTRVEAVEALRRAREDKRDDA